MAPAEDARECYRQWRGFNILRGGRWIAGSRTAFLTPYVLGTIRFRNHQSPTYASNYVEKGYSSGLSHVETGSQCLTLWERRRPVCRLPITGVSDYQPFQK